MISRRRLLQAAAVAPALGVLGPAARAAASGAPVGAGLELDASALVGLSCSWTGPGAGARVWHQLAGEWQGPTLLLADHAHGPPDPTGRNHSAPMLVAGADRYRVQPADGSDLRVHPLDTDDAVGARRSAFTFDEPIPGLEILHRSNWTSLARRDTIDCTIPASVFGLGCRSDVGLRHGVIHHTVNVNAYDADDVPALLRGIQRFHVDTRGWDDIGYNFVVDRFGRIWHAREGDILEPITSGHTLGLNAESVGVAVLGTFSTDAVPDAVVATLGTFFGWKLGLHGVDPLGRTSVRSSGGDFAEPGDFVVVDNISGHRDNQQTSCPGTQLYERIDEVRAAAGELVPAFGSVTPTYTLDDVTVDGWAIDRFDPTRTMDVEIIVDGGDPELVPAADPVEGLDEDYPDAGADHGFHRTVPIDLDTTSIVVRLTAADERTADLMDLTLFATFVDVEPDRFFAPGVRFLREKGLTTGTQPGLFEPMDEVSRAQMATFLHRFMDLPEPTAPSPFEDVEAESFYEAAVDWLFEAGITTGTSPTEFSPDDFVTRGQMATFLWRICGEPDPSSASPFTDVPSGAFFADAVAWMAELGITTGISPTEFDPEGDVTRGEMATFLLRLATTSEAWALVEPPSVVEL